MDGIASEGYTCFGGTGMGLTSEKPPPGQSVSRESYTFQQQEYSG